MDITTVLKINNTSFCIFTLVFIVHNERDRFDIFGKLIIGDQFEYLIGI